MKTYTQLASELKETMPMLHDELMETGGHMEAQITDAEERQKGVQAMLEVILNEVDEVEGQLSLLTKGKRTITHECIERIRSLTEVARSYNGK